MPVNWQKALITTISGDTEIVSADSVIASVDPVFAEDYSLTSIHSTGNILPVKYLLSQNYPNSFSPTTVINFQFQNPVLFP